MKGGLARVVAAALFFLSACSGSEDQRSSDRSPTPVQSPAASGSPSASEPLDDKPKLTAIGDFEQPVLVAAPSGDPRVFVVEKTGVVRVLDGGRKETFLDISDDVSSGSEQGLLSMAFAPDYKTSGLAYVDYTDTEGDTRIVEYRVDGRNSNRLDPRSRRELISVQQPFANHNGGLVLFDPSGMLLVGMGDGGSSGDPGNRAQNLGQLLGKILRIDPSKPSGGKQYGIPPDNPFVGRAGVRPEIWAYGLRNPWRFSFAPDSGDLFVGDVGQNRFEEISFVPKASQSGANFGWPKFEGTTAFKNVQIDESKLVVPVLTYSLGGNGCAVTSGGIYRGSVNSLKGRYLYADFCSGRVRSFRIADGKAEGDSAVEGLQTESLSSFGEDSRGEMYVTSLSGKVFRIDRES